MKRRDLDYAVIVLLVGSSLYVFFTGLIADTMGLHHFGFHSQVGYFWMSLAVAHLSSNLGQGQSVCASSVSRST